MLAFPEPCQRCGVTPFPLPAPGHAGGLGRPETAALGPWAHPRAVGTQHPAPLAATPGRRLPAASSPGCSGHKRSSRAKTTKPGPSPCWRGWSRSRAASGSLWDASAVRAGCPQEHRDVPGSFGAGKGCLQPGSCSQALKDSGEARLLSWCCPVVAPAGRPGKLLPRPAARSDQLRGCEAATRSPGAQQAGSSPGARPRPPQRGCTWCCGTAASRGRSSPRPITWHVQAPLLQRCRPRSPRSLAPSCTKRRGTFPTPLAASLLAGAAACPRRAEPGAEPAKPPARADGGLEELLALCKVIRSRGRLLQPTFCPYCQERVGSPWAPSPDHTSIWAQRRVSSPAQSGWS